MSQRSSLARVGSGRPKGMLRAFGTGVRALPLPALVLWLMGAATLSAQTPGSTPPPVSCTVAPDPTVPVRAEAGRNLYCVIDVGSRSVKLSVISLEPAQPATAQDERLCRRTLGMGALVFDSTTNTARPLPDSAIDLLSDTIRRYQEICQLDRAVLLGAGATQWARDATNITDVTTRMRAATGVALDVLAPRQEAEYGYLAASLGVPGRIVLDPGSNSFQLSWQPRSAATPTSVLIPYGYVRASTNDFETAADYQAARLAYGAKVRARIDEALAQLSPPADLAELARLVRSGALGREVVTLGQDGAVQLAVRGTLRDAGGAWLADTGAYNHLISGQRFTTDPEFGIVTARPITAPELRAYLAGLGTPDLKALTAEPIRGLYGQKALVVPALVDVLMRALGAERLVMVPQEAITGYALAKLDESSGNAPPR